MSDHQGPRAAAVAGLRPPRAAEREEEDPLDTPLRPKTYRACTTIRGRGVAQALEIIAGTQYEAPSYRLYVNLAAGVTYDQYFMIVFSTTIYKVTGKNLQPVYRAIAAGRALTIRTFDTSYHDKAPDEEPLITKIEIERKQPIEEAYGQAQKIIQQRAN